MSQNSQSYGQPREYWMFMVAYLRLSINSHNGIGVVVRSAHSISRVQVFGPAEPEVFQEQRQRDFRLVQDKVIHPLEFLMPGGKQRPAGDNLRPRLIAARNHLPGGFRLDGHPAQENKVCPLEISSA